jgi:indole-3-glycerol phosphate synthase
MARASRERSLRACAELPLAALRTRARAMSAPPLLRLSPHGFDLLAEVKFAAPTRGALVPENPTPAAAAQRAEAYARAGAAAVSVLTEPDAFQGSLAHLRAAARAVSVPVMRKDFLVSTYQVWEARVHGAGGVLLVVRLLTEEQLDELVAQAFEAQLFVLIEAFDAPDLARATRAIERAPHGARLLVGVNGRDLATLEIDPERHLTLARALPRVVPAVAESGLCSAADLERAARAGYSLGLVGTALMQSARPEDLARQLLLAARRAREEDACGSR